MMQQLWRKGGSIQIVHRSRCRHIYTLGSGKRSGQLKRMSHDIKTMFLKNDQGIVKVDLHLFYGLWQGGEFKGL